MIDKPLEEMDPLLREEAEVEIDIVNPEVVSIETEDGGMIIEFGPPEEEGDSLKDLPHSANLAEHLDDNILSSIGTKVLDVYEEDLNSRQDWERAYKEGLDYLGVKTEDRNKPWAGACGLFHNMIMEAAVRFQSNAIMEIFPASGPVKTQIVGEVTEEKEDQALRIQTDMNYLLTQDLKDYRPETERMLFGLALCGSAFKKICFDPLTDMPDIKYVPAQDFIMPYGATSLKTASRYIHVLAKNINEVKKLQYTGFYREASIQPDYDSNSQLKDKIDKISYEYKQGDEDMVTLLEAHIDLDIEGLEHTDEDGEPTGIALPYVVTVDKSSGKVLSVYRNWDESDPKKNKLIWFSAYNYVPGMGAYGYGLIHLIGGNAKASTAILRQLIDSGTLANLPGGLKAKGMRVAGDDSPIQPGEWRDVDVANGDIARSLYPLPYKEPSQTLFQLLGNVVEDGRRLASIADAEIGDVNSQAPVGTTLAIMERALKVMSAIQARLHASLQDEFSILVRVIRDSGSDRYKIDFGKMDGSKRDDFSDRIDVIPVSDPNAATMSQRVMQYQAAIQLAAQAPQFYDLPELHRKMLEVLGIKDVKKIIPEKIDAPLLDPLSENINLTNMKPAKAYQVQDHESHIKAHMAYVQSPSVQQQLGQNPQANAIFAAFMAHIAEHVGFAYRAQIEQKLGIPLPAPGEPMPGDIESNLSKAIADASTMLLQQAQTQQQQQQFQQQAQDPVMQLQQAELQIKQAELQQKAQESQQKAQLEMVKNQTKAQLETARIQSQAQMAQQTAAVKAQQVQSELALDNQRLQLEIERLQKDRQESEARIQADMQRIQTENDMAKAKIAEILARMDAMGGSVGPEV
jgi:hypothetical protein